jgi:hypothetical protein
MKVRGILAVALPLLLSYLPAAQISASSAAGKMTTTGSAEVNGVAAPAVTSVFVGDRIATKKEATTSLSFAGGDSVVLPELTQAALGQKDGRFVVNLQDGTVSVMNKTMTPILIEVHGARCASRRVSREGRRPQRIREFRFALLCVPGSYGAPRALCRAAPVAPK